MTRWIATLLIGVAAGFFSYFLYVKRHAPSEIGHLEGQLAWMQGELNLSPAQLDRIRTVHLASVPRLRQMAAQLAQLRDEFTAFEETRRTKDTVDFVEFARFVETRRSVNQAALETTRNVVDSSAEVMNPVQRKRYLELVATADPTIGSLYN